MKKEYKGRKMKYKKEKEKLGLPEDFKFGIEIEAFNVNTYGKDGLYKGESLKYIKEKNWHTAGKMEESLVSHGGAELVSPILKDEERCWEDIEEICEHIKKYPRKRNE